MIGGLENLSRSDAHKRLSTVEVGGRWRYSWPSVVRHVISLETQDVQTNMADFQRRNFKSIDPLLSGER